MGIPLSEYDLTARTSFRANLSNVLAVRVDRQRGGRFSLYPGSGNLQACLAHVAGPVHIAPWGTYVRRRLPREATEEALASIETRVIKRIARRLVLRSSLPS